MGLEIDTNKLLQMQQQQQQGNKAVVTKEELVMPKDRKRYCNDSLTKVALTLEPDGLEHLGSFACHMYKRKNSAVSLGTDEYFMINQPVLGNAPEGLTDKAYKELKEELMSAYGRKQPKRRKV